MSRYVLGRKIGEGGFGEVFIATPEDSSQEFALKRIFPNADEEAKSRFSREVRILSSLRHPNVIRVLTKNLEQFPYIAIMPLYRNSLEVELPSLIGNESRIKKIFDKILAGIEYAHKEGVIHRDLKPENILINTDDDVVVSDFGLCRKLDSMSVRYTKTGKELGTFLYMPPEQFDAAKQADFRSDIFSLGRMLYEMYTEPLSSPFHDATKINHPGLRFLIDKCLQQDPGNRFQTVSELRAAWDSVNDRTVAFVETNELMTLPKTIAIKGVISKEDLVKIAPLLAKHQHEASLIHEFIMTSPPQLISELILIYPDLMRQVMQIYVNNCMEQGWNFSYTDDIGNVSFTIHALSTDLRIRALMIHCLLEVGYSHNRWHVIGLFNKAMHAKKLPGEGYAIFEHLSAAQSRHLKQALSNLNKSELDPDLQRLFTDPKPIVGADPNPW